MTRKISGLPSLMALGVLAAGTFAVPSLTIAQQKSDTRTYEFNIEPGAMGRALVQYSEISRVQLVYDSEFVKDVRTKGLTGSYSAEEALARLLEQSGLRARFTSRTTATVIRVEATGARELGPVRVEGAGTNGINGSRDVTATEGTGSYTSGALSIASKSPQSIKDTPQSVSVITQQRMQDQNLTDFRSLMDQATGVTLVTSSSLSTKFFSRGFEISRVQIDGGAPMALNMAHNGNSANFYPFIDMAMYDHAEILRGADGLLNGYGDPGGVVNLARKRPLAQKQVVVETQFGSWNNYRTVVDAAAPLGFDDRLRGRAVISYEDKDFFYDIASSNHTLAYGTLEMDVTDSTLLSGGFSFTRMNMVPWPSSMPRYQNGDDLKRSRSFCLCFPWNRSNFETKEVFARVDQEITEDWSLKLNLTRVNQESDSKFGHVSGAVNPIDGSGMFFGGSMSHEASVQTLADFTISGGFELFGNRQEIVVGANWQDVDSGGSNAYRDLVAYPYPGVDIFTFNPSAPEFAEPAATDVRKYYPVRGEQQWGAYMSLRLTPWERLHIITGLRYSHYEFESVEQDICTAQKMEYGECDTIGTVVGVPFKVAYRGSDLSWPPVYSLVYDLRPGWSLYGSYTDIYESQANYVTPDLAPAPPTTGSNIEVGLKREGLAGRFNATLSVYRVEQKNWPKFLDYGPYASTYGKLPDGTRICCYITSDQASVSQGLDGEVTGEVLPGWQISAGYSWNTNEYTGRDASSNQGTPIHARTPKHLLKLWSSYQFQEGEWLRRLSVGGGVNAQTESFENGHACVRYMIDADGDVECDYDNNGFVSYVYRQGFYAVFSGRVAYQLDPRWNVSLNVNNIADRTYYQTAGSNGWYGEPRSFMLTMRGQF